ncbi:isoaspartyl peptidase/L-asparaginase [Sphingomonas aerolata]
MLVGEGATQFARDQGFKQQSLLTPEAEKVWRDWLKTRGLSPRSQLVRTASRGRPVARSTMTRSAC